MVPLKQFKRLLGHMAAAAAVTPLGLLHMRPLQHWFYGWVPRWAWQHGTHWVQVIPAIVPRVWAGWLPGNPEAPARLFAQGSHYSFQGSGREPASVAPWGGRPSPALLCPVHALRWYVDRTQSFRTSDQLFVCYGGRQKGNDVSKQRMAHWLVDAITLAYQAQGEPCPLRLRAHSTRIVSSSWALARGASLTDICSTVVWATLNTFARFYSLCVETVSSCALTSNG